MKTIKYFLAITFSFLSVFSFAQANAVKTEKIKVSGNCGMCKGHIEKAAKAAGASYASWDKNTKLLSVKYETDKTTNLQIQQHVAKAGYDTKDVKADDKAYGELDDCCKYKRKS